MKTSARQSSGVRIASLALTRLCLALSLVMLSAPARADICFPKPVALPGLSGPPVWQGSGTVRPELNEPRWAAAPQTGFASDLTDSEGIYRLLVNSANNELSISFQVPIDPDTASTADQVWFGFTRDGAAGTLASAVRISLPTSGTNPIAATNVRGYTYDAAASIPWTPGTIGVAPDWLKDAAAWLEGSAPSLSWGINLKVDLTAPSVSGVNVAQPLNLMLAMQVRDESDPTMSLLPSTPDPGCPPSGPCAHPLLAGTLLIENPADWAPALAINAACPPGIELVGSQIGTTNEDPPGTPAPNKINTTSGATNTFYARPSYPFAPGSGEIVGTFHVANWGSIAASNAPWIPIPNGSNIENGVAPATMPGEISFVCPASTATEACGIPKPSEAHQCVYVELKNAPGQNNGFSKAAAYRNMRFEPLSRFSGPAEISVKGLAKVFGNDKPRDVYVFVKPRNMPAHGNDPFYLNTEAMAATRRFAETPPRAPQPPKGVPLAVFKRQLKAGQLKALRRPAAQQPKLREIPTPNTGIKDLDLTVEQALASVWPTYDVRVYYDTGSVVEIEGEKVRHFKAMYPFTYYFSHQGPLYGFTHELKGATLKQIRDNVYYLSIQNEGAAQVTTSVEAHEEPKGETPGEPGNCPTCPSQPPPTPKPCTCNCRLPGGTETSSWPLLAAGLLGLGWMLRRRLS